MKRVQFVVHGKVQGVGFRYFTRERARELNVTGYCRNTADQKVEGEAQAPAEVLDTFLKHIDKGPGHARVTKIETVEQEVLDGETVFEVTR